MEYLVIADEFADPLAAAGLDRFDALMRGPVGETIKRKPGREVRRVAVGERLFFLRRVDAEPVGMALRSWARLRRAESPCVREARLIEALRRQGIAVMRAAAWGERRVLGVPRESFLLAEGVAGRELDVVFRDADDQQRCEIAAALGTLLGRLNQLGYFQRLRLRDLIVTQNPPQLVLIDRETTRTDAQPVTMERCCDCLARCWCKLIQTGHHLQKTLLQKTGQVRFLRAYADMMGWSKKQRRQAVARVKHRVESLTRRGGKYERPA